MVKVDKEKADEETHWTLAADYSHFFILCYDTWRISIKKQTKTNPLPCPQPVHSCCHNKSRTLIDFFPVLKLTPAELCALKMVISVRKAMNIVRSCTCTIFSTGWISSPWRHLLEFEQIEQGFSDQKIGNCQSLHDTKINFPAYPSFQGDRKTLLQALWFYTRAGRATKKVSDQNASFQMLK